MAYHLEGRTAGTIAVLGASGAGPDMALVFSQALHRRGVKIVLGGAERAALESAAAAVRKKLDKQIERKILKPEQAEEILRNIELSPGTAGLAGADLVVEASPGNLDARRAQVEEAARVAPAQALILAVADRLEPDALFASTPHRERCLVIHPFPPADRNMLVEVAPAGATAAGAIRFVLRLFELIGKLPILVKSRPGFAVIPIGEGISQALGSCVEEGVCDARQGAAIAKKALGFAAGGAEEQVEFPEETYAEVSATLLAAYFGLAAATIDEGITSPADLDLAVELGLGMPPPFAAINRIGPERALALVEAYSRRRKGFPVADCLCAHGQAGMPFDLPVVLRRDEGAVAVVTIRRPRVLNALDGNVLWQLKELFAGIREDDRISAAVLTGFGVKAFVSGADINEIASLASPEEALAYAARGQRILNEIEDLGKPVVAAMNGLAFGGGNELAMACTCRICASGQRVLAGQPEPNLGIIPGYGGTQRLPRLVGIEAAWPLLRTGLPISSDKAVELGLARRAVPLEELLPEAVGLAARLASGEETAPPILEGPLAVPASLPEVELGHLSRRIDEIVQRAVLEGAAMGLGPGLVNEANLFGACYDTEDLKIGMKNFLENGPKSKAEFKHR